MSKKEKVLLDDNSRLIEAILFVENEPVSLEKLMHMTKLKSDEITKSCENIKEFYDDNMHGIELLFQKNRYYFSPSSDLHERFKTCYGKKVDRRLTKAALETLTIIAYKQPITRREVDNLRGVASDTIVRLLRDRDYIKVVGRKKVPGNPCLYGTTRKFLVEFDMNSISELPRLSEVDELRFDLIDDSDDELDASIFDDTDDEGFDFED